MKKYLSVPVRAIAMLLVFFSLSIGVLAAPDSEKAEKSKNNTSVETVYPGGMPFGIKLYTEGLLVVELSEVECDSGTVSPAAEAGIKAGDVIICVNGKKITTAEELVSQIEKSHEKLEITYLRDKKEYTVNIKPCLSKDDGKYRTGMWLRDSTAGIGTVTYIVPESGEFAGLGHGICDPESGEPVKFIRGIANNVKISGVKRGDAGAPGELKGYFTDLGTGVILKNTNCGIFGIFNRESAYENCQNKISVGKRSDIKLGDAEIISTVDEKGPEKYKIEITELSDSDKTVNFGIRVTDEALIEKTGGIVQGMSGSPIIQNGKLVGAVTHVLINDPLCGYGIYIESMLGAAV